MRLGAAGTSEGLALARYQRALARRDRRRSIPRTILPGGGPARGQLERPALHDPARGRVVRTRELDHERAHLGTLRPGRVHDLDRPENGFAGRDARPLVTDLDPAAALHDH